MDVNERQVAGNDVPSFDDLLFDDTLDDLERIGRYATSAIALQRLVHVRLVGETARAVGCVFFFSDERARARACARMRSRLCERAHASVGARVHTRAHACTVHVRARGSWPTQSPSALLRATLPE